MGMKPRNQPPAAWEWYRNRVAQEWAALRSSAPISKPYRALRLIDCAAVTGPLLAVTSISLDRLARLASAPVAPSALRGVARWLIEPPHLAENRTAQGSEMSDQANDLGPHLGPNSDPAELYPGPWTDARAQRRAAEADQTTKGG